MVSGVAGEASQHIQNMVAMQKTTVKGKSRKRGKGKKSGRYGQSNYDREMDSWHRQFAPPPPPAKTKKAPPPTRTSRPPPPAPRTSSEQRGCSQKFKIVGAMQGPNLTEKTIAAVTMDLVLCGKRVRELLMGRQHGLYIAQLHK